MSEYKDCPYCKLPMQAIPDDGSPNQCGNRHCENFLNKSVPAQQERIRIEKELNKKRRKNESH